MATTWIKALHKSGGSIAAALDRTTDYIENPEKTNDGELIIGYECDPFTAQSEFLLSKRLYEQQTGRDQGKHDVIAYHVRMSFKPGEVTAEQALELGRELASRWTKNKHQFIVAAHTNTKNPHAHIIYNSVNLDCTGKYQDFKRSAIALRRLSDQICLEKGLSIIEKPGLSKGYNRHEYLGEIKPPSVREQLRDLIDSVIPVCKNYDEFLAAFEAKGVEIKRGKQLSFKLPGGKKFSRQDTLGDDYTFEAILERISGKRIIAPKTKTAPIHQPPQDNLLTQIQRCVVPKGSPGYDRWAAVFNIKQLAKTFNFLQENNLLEYDKLSEKAQQAKDDFNAISARIKVIDVRLPEITSLQRHIGTYSKTKDIYAEYKKSNWSKKFYAENKEKIELHKSAKKAFDALGLAKLPTIKTLQTEYAALESEKNLCG